MCTNVLFYLPDMVEKSVLSLYLLWAFFKDKNYREPKVPVNLVRKNSKEVEYVIYLEQYLRGQYGVSSKK